MSGAGAVTPGVQGGALMGLSSQPLLGLLISPWYLGRVSAAFRPPGSRPAGDSGREAADELDAPSVAQRGPVWSAA